MSGGVVRLDPDKWPATCATLRYLTTGATKDLMRLTWAAIHARARGVNLVSVECDLTDTVVVHVDNSSSAGGRRDS